MLSLRLSRPLPTLSSLPPLDAARWPDLSSLLELLLRPRLRLSLLLVAQPESRLPEVEDLPLDGAKWLLEVEDLTTLGAGREGAASTSLSLLDGEIFLNGIGYFCIYCIKSTL